MIFNSILIFISLFACQDTSKNDRLKPCDSPPEESIIDIDNRVAVKHIIIDLNYDNKKDKIINYFYINFYGGPFRTIDDIYIKNGDNCYKRDTTYPFFNKGCPSFFIKEKKITTFGLWKQGGYGFEYIWQDSIWVINKKFEVENKGKNTIWKITYIKNNKIVKILAPYNKYPPENVLKVDEYYKKTPHYQWFYAGEGW